MDVLVNKGGVTSPHGLDINHKQAAGDVSIAISQDNLTGVRFKVSKEEEVFADIVVNYDGQIILESEDVHLGGVATENAVLGKKLVTVLGDLITDIEEIELTTTQGVTTGLVLSSHFDSTREELETILSEKVKWL